jgi:hypothetical protein
MAKLGASLPVSYQNADLLALQRYYHTYSVSLRLSAVQGRKWCGLIRVGNEIFMLLFSQRVKQEAHPNLFYFRLF